MQKDQSQGGGAGGAGFRGEEGGQGALREVKGRIIKRRLRRKIEILRDKKGGGREEGDGDEGERTAQVFVAMSSQRAPRG